MHVYLCPTILGKKMNKCEKTGIADMAGITQQKSWSDCAEKEAKIISWVYPPKEARNHIKLNLEHTRNAGESGDYKFWLEVEKAFNAITARQVDEVEEFIHLLRFANELKPRAKWIAPLLKSTAFQDFRTQLFALVEDYKNT